MKNVLLIATALIILTFGCKKEEVNAKVAASVMGKWYPVKTVNTKYATTPPVVTTNIITTLNDYLLFNNGGVGERKSGASISNIQYILSGSILSITYPIPSNITIDYDVMELSASVLNLKETKKDNTGKTTETNEVYCVKQ